MPTRPNRRDGTNNSADRLPPHSDEAERGVLGCLLLDPNNCIPAAIERLSGASADFYDLRHQTIYSTIIELWDDRIQPDVITLNERLRTWQRLEECGGINYLSSLPDEVPSSANLSSYADIVAEKAALRRMIQTCIGVVGRIYDYEGEIDGLMDEVERDVMRCAEQRVQHRTANTRDLVRTVIANMDEFHNHPGQLTGIATGFSDIDAMTRGLRNGHMVVIAARPGMGKTSLAMTIADNVSVTNHIPVGVFSLEMTGQDLIERMICSRARVNMMEIRDGALAERDFPKLTGAAGSIASAPLFIDDSSGMSVLQLRAKARRMVQQHGIRLFIVDYLQLMQGGGRRYESRQVEVSDISRGIKGLAKELNVPVIALSQLNRQIEHGKGRRPQLADLRDSGCISADTLVYGPKLISRISSLSVDTDGGTRLYSASMKNKIGAATVTRAWSSGTKPVFEMVLATGHTIRATATHKFYGFGNRWMTLSELQPGDQIAIALNAPTGRNQTVSDAEARLLGLLVSNGCTLPRRSFQLTLNSQDEDLAAMATADAKTIFGGALRPHIEHESPATRPGHSWIQVFFPSVRVPSKLHRSDMSVWLEHHELLGKRAKDKEIPTAMFLQPKPVIARFLSSLFSGDGTTGITVKPGRKPGSEKRQYLVASYSSSSRRLVDGIQWLLQCLGIVSGISTVESRGFACHNLQVYSRTSKLRFADQVGFMGRRKDAMMKRVVAAMIEAPLGWEKYIPSGDLAFVPIKTISPKGREQVWDATVPSNSNFVANGIVTHNSIEQDADLVAFLYKAAGEEETGVEDHYTKLLIAKQRGGPTGEIDLAFLREFTRFESAARVSADDVPNDNRQQQFPDT